MCLEYTGEVVEADMIEAFKSVLDRHIDMQEMEFYVLCTGR